MKIPFDVEFFPSLHLTPKVSHAPDLTKRRIAFFRCVVGTGGPLNQPGNRERLWVYTRRYSFFVDWTWL